MTEHEFCVWLKFTLLDTHDSPLALLYAISLKLATVTTDSECVYVDTSSTYRTASGMYYSLPNKKGWDYEG